MKRKYKVLVTGVAGFIGSNLADRLLKSGYFVVGIDNLAYGLKEQVDKRVDLHRLDIRSSRIYPLFRGVDFVFHLAAKNVLGDCQKDPVATSDINVTGTVNVLEAAKRANVKRLIYAESSAIYEGIAKIPTDESEVKPRSIYAISKLCDNLFADAYNRYFGLKTVGIRYFNVYGPRQDYRRSIPPIMSEYIIKLLQKKQPVIFGSPAKKRDFIHIDDVNDFHLLCLQDKPVDGKVFNIGYGKSFSFMEVYQAVSQLLKINLPPEFKEDLPGVAMDTVADIGEAKKIGWRPRISLITGLKSLIEYIKAERDKGNIV